MPSSLTPPLAQWSRLFARPATSLIDEAHRRFAAGDGGAAASLAEFCIGRIDALNRRGPCLGAILEVNPRAGRRERTDEAGAPAQPLRGIPLVIKDNIVTASDPLGTTCGSDALLGARYRTDATLVSRARRAGGVVLAKANMPEFGLTAPSARGGPVRNPMDGLRTQPGGSSNGVAVALASGMAVGGFGTDARGSIRTPCAECAVVGLRPTIGMVSRHGVGAFQLHDVAGPLARSVRDVAILLGAVAAEADPLDPLTELYHGRRSADYVSGLGDAGSLRGARLAVLAGIADGLSSEVRQGYERATRLLTERGAQITVMAADFWDAEAPGRLASHPAAQSVAAGALRRFVANWSADSPIRTLDDLHRRVHGAAPADGEGVGGAEGMLAALAGAPAVEDDVARCDALLQAPRAVFAAALRASGADALVVPTAAWALPLEPPLAPIIRHDTAFAVACAWAGLPELVVPMAPAPTHPLGLSFVAPPFGEAALLALGHAFEQALAERASPPFPS